MIDPREYYKNHKTKYSKKEKQQGVKQQQSNTGYSAQQMPQQIPNMQQTEYAQEIFDKAFDNAFGESNKSTTSQQQQKTKQRNTQQTGQSKGSWGENIAKRQPSVEMQGLNRYNATNGNILLNKSDAELGITPQQLQQGAIEYIKNKQEEQEQIYQALQQLKNTYYNNEEIGGLYDNTIRKLLNDAETIYKAPKPSGDSSKSNRVKDIKNFGRGLKDKIVSENFLTMGLSDARDAYNLNRVSKSFIDKYNSALKSTKNEQEAIQTAFSQLSKAEQGVMLAMQIKQQIEQQRNGNISLAYLGAGVTGDMIPFAVQLLASGGITNLMNAGAKAGLKKIRKKAAKGFENFVANKYGKGLEVAIVNTGISPMTYSDFADERFNARVLEQRELTAKEKAKITARNFFDNATETVGGKMLHDAFEIGKGFIKSKAKFIKSKANEIPFIQKTFQGLSEKNAKWKGFIKSKANEIPFIQKTFQGLSEKNAKWKGFFTAIADNKATKFMREQAYIGNFAEEYGEEGINAVLNTGFGVALNDDEMKRSLQDFIAPDNQKILGISLLVGTSALPTVVGTFSYISQHNKIKRYRRAKEIFENELSALGFDAKNITSAIEMAMAGKEYNSEGIKNELLTSLKKALQGYQVQGVTLIDPDKIVDKYIKAANGVNDLMKELDERLKKMSNKDRKIFLNDLTDELQRQATNNILFHNVKEGYYFSMTDATTGKKENYLAQVQSKNGALGFVIAKLEDSNGKTVFRIKNDDGQIQDMTIEQIREANVGGEYENTLITFKKVSDVLGYLQNQAEENSSLQTEIRLRNLLADYVEIDSEGNQNVNTGLTTDGRQIFINDINQEAGTVSGLVQSENGYEREQLNISDIATMRPQNINDIILSSNILFDNINRQEQKPNFANRTDLQMIEDEKRKYQEYKDKTFTEGEKIRLQVKDGIDTPEIVAQNGKEGIIEKVNNDGTIQVKFDDGIRILPIENKNYEFEKIDEQTQDEEQSTTQKSADGNTTINPTDKQQSAETEFSTLDNSEGKGTTKSLNDKIKSGEIYENEVEQTFDDLLEEFDDNEEDTVTYINNKISSLSKQIKNHKTPKKDDTNIIKQARQKLNKLQSELDYWQRVKQVSAQRRQQDIQRKKEQKSQSNTEQTVAIGKTLKQETIKKISDWFNDTVRRSKKNTRPETILRRNGNGLLNILVKDGVLQTNDVAQYEEKDGRLSGAGMDYCKNILLGSCLEEESIRICFDNENVLDKVLLAIGEIADNKGLGEEYSLNEEINNAVKVIAECERRGITVKDYFAQTSIFDESNLKSQTVMLLSEKLSSEDKSELKEVLSLYNNSAREESVNGAGLFSDKKTKEELLTQIINKYGQDRQDTTESKQTSIVDSSRQDTSDNAGQPANDGRTSTTNSNRGNEKGEIKPTFLDVIKDLFSKGKEAVAEKYKQSFFDVADTPKFMQDLGLSGQKFTIKYGVISRHFGKDNSHDLDERIWEQLPQAIQSPFAITEYYKAEDNKKQNKGYRLYTTLQVNNGFIVVGVDVKNAGRDFEINAISTVFSRDNGGITEKEKEIYRSKKITPEQEALLRKPNSSQYQPMQELSNGKVTTNSESSKGKEKENNILRRVEEYLQTIESPLEATVIRRALNKSFTKEIGGKKQKVTWAEYIDYCIKNNIEIPNDNKITPVVWKYYQWAKEKEQSSEKQSIDTKNSSLKSENSSQKRKTSNNTLQNTNNDEKDKRKKIEDFGEKIGGAKKDKAQARIAAIKKLSNVDLEKIEKLDKIFPKKELLRLFKEGKMQEQTARQLLALVGLFDGSSVNRKHAIGKNVFEEKIRSLYIEQLTEWNNNNEVIIDIQEKIDKLCNTAIKDYEDYIEKTKKPKPSELSDEEYTKQIIEYNREKSSKYNMRFFLIKMHNQLSQILFTYDKLNFPQVERKNLNYYIITGKQDEVLGYGKIGSRSYYIQKDLDKCIEKINEECPTIEQAEDKDAAKNDKLKVGHLSVVKNELGWYVIKSNRINGDITFTKRFSIRKDAEKYLQDNAEKLQRQEENMYETLYSSSLLQAERQGIDYRQGRDISEQEFLDTFGFRGVEFGNYVTQKERQPILNRTYDAIMDFCAIVGISPKAFSLGGRLGLAFGARGSGKAMAHYEPLKEVINLTRTKGAGSLAHEWFHTLDNFLAKNVTGNTTSYLSSYRGTDVRKELVEVFNEIRMAIFRSDYSSRSEKAGKKYWGSEIEMFARAFQGYIQDKLDEKENVSPILTRGNPEPTIQELQELYNGQFPLTLKAERKVFNPLFDKLFSTIQEKTDENGNKILFQKVSESSIITEEDALLRDAVVEVLGDAIGKDNVIATSDNDLLQQIIDNANGEIKPMGTRGAARMRQIYHKIFGGNRGYVGYSMSKRAEQAREEGRFPKTDFKKKYNISSDEVLDLLVSIGIIDNTEWHHTSKYGNKTTFYGWVDKSYIQQYAEHKKEINKIVQQNKQQENPYKHTLRSNFSEEFQKLPYNVNSKALQEFLDTHTEDKAKYEENKKYNEWQSKAESRIERNARIGDEIAKYFIQFFKTPQGEVFGFTVGGKIYIDTTKAKADTPIHEYAHLWAKVLRQNNPKEWQNIVKLMKKETKLWNEVKQNYPELKTDDDIADEVLAHYSGANGLKRLNEVVARAKADKNKTILEKGHVFAALNNIKKALDRFWKGVADFLHIHFTTAQEVADRVLSDLLNGVNPNEYLTENSEKRASNKQYNAEETEYSVNDDIRFHKVDEKSVTEMAKELADIKEIADSTNIVTEEEKQTRNNKSKSKKQTDEHRSIFRKIADKAIAYFSQDSIRSFADDYHPLRKDVDHVIGVMREKDKNFRLQKDVYEQQIAAKAATNGQIFLFEQEKFVPLLNKIQSVCKRFQLTQKEVEHYLMFLFYPERTTDITYNRYTQTKDKIANKEKVSDANKKLYDKINLWQKTLTKGEREQAEKEGNKIFNTKFNDLPFENNDELNKERQKCIEEQIIRKACDKYRDNELYTIRDKNEIKEFNGVMIPLSKNDKISGFAGEDDMYHSPLYSTIVDKYFPEKKDNFETTRISPYEITQKFREMIGKDNAEEIERRIQDINKFSLDKALDAGSITEEEYVAYQRNKYYVPLRGWDNDNEIDVFGGDISFQKVNPSAKGRKLTADTPLKYMFEIACRQIYESNERKAKLALINFYYKYRDILMGEDSVAYWTWTDKDGKERQSFERPTRKEIEGDSLRFNIMDNEYDRIHTNALKRHLFEFRNGNTTYRLYLKSTFLANVLRNEKLELPETVANIMKFVRGISYTTRYMSGMMTSKNPAFATANFIRDFSSVYFLDERTKDDFPNFNNVFTKNLINMKTTADMVFNAQKAVAEGRKLTEKQAEVLKLYKQWLHHGGLSGYSYFLSDLDKDFNRRYKDMIKSTGRKIYEGLSPVHMEYFNKISEFTENQVRFAAFRTYLETNPNITVEEAVYRSKEATLNFSRKGWGTRTFGFFFPFFNATCQGIIKLARLLRYNPTRFWRSFGLFLGFGLVDASLSLFFGGDDDKKKKYLQVNDYVAERNIIIGGAKIPIPQELYLPFTAGVSLVKAAAGKMTPTEATYRTLSAFMSLLPEELGSSLGALAEYDQVNDEITLSKHPFIGVMNALAPGFLSPIMDYKNNRDFMGGQILPKENKKGQIPQAGRYDEYKTYGIYQDIAFGYNNLYNIIHTTKIGKSMGEPISWDREYYEKLVADTNTIVNKNGRAFDLRTISPMAIQFFVGSYAAGLNNIVSKIGDMVSGRKEFELENVPIVDRLVVRHNEHSSLYKKMDLVYDIVDQMPTEKEVNKDIKRAKEYDKDISRFEKLQKSKNAEVVRRYNANKDNIKALSISIKLLKIQGAVKNKEQIDKKLDEQEAIFDEILAGWSREY